MPPWLSDAEIRELCEGLIQPAAQARYIERVLGLPVKRKPNGRPIVPRSAIDRMGAAPPAAAAPAARPASDRPQPDAAGLQLFLARRKLA